MLKKKLRLNVVNAVFVQQTMKTASSDEELAFKQKERDISAQLGCDPWISSARHFVLQNGFVGWSKKAKKRGAQVGRLG